MTHRWKMSASIAVTAMVACATVAAQGSPPCYGQAAAEVRLGTPPNPDVFKPGASLAPVLGSNWAPYIDHLGFMPLADLDGCGVLFGHSSAYNLYLGQMGTVLGLGTPTYIFAQPGQSLGFFIPNNPVYLGAELVCQGFAVRNGYPGAEGLRLTNALDITVGSGLPPADVVITEYGAVRGSALPEGIHRYLGIPYAAAPAGNLRWRAPEEPACWNGELLATSYGPACPQFDNLADPNSFTGSEDCLRLNVWAPDDPAEPLPVMLYMHGGSHWHGHSGVTEFNYEGFGGGVTVYDGRHLAAHGAVVVTINYRLGLLGYMAHPDLEAESPTGTASGNYGVMDQIAALQWVQRNIAAFGGDPERVLVFGQSAGGVDTVTLLSSPLASGLFSSAYVMSGTPRTVSKTQAEATSDSVVQAVKNDPQLGCGVGLSDVACLRQLTAQQLMEKVRQLGIGNNAAQNWLPVVDGYVLPQSQLDVFEAGAHNKVPVMISTAINEVASLMGGYYSADQAALANDLITRSGIDPLVANAAAARYYSNYGGDPETAFIALLSDMSYHEPNRMTARAIAGNQTEPVYRALFTRTYNDGVYIPNPYIPGAPNTLMDFGPVHSVDLYYVFNGIWYWGTPDPPADDVYLAAEMRDYLVQFARTGNPNAPGDTESTLWPVFDDGVTDDHHIIFDVPILSGTGVRTADCDFWQQSGVYD